MAKDEITIDGEEVIVREDTAKAWRFMHWGVITGAIGLAIIVVLLFITFFMGAAVDGNPGNPDRPKNINSKSSP